MLGLLETREQRGDDLGQVRRELLTEYAGHDAEEQEAALLEAGATELDAGERLLHHARKVWAKLLLADCVGERADRVHRNPAELLLLALARKHEEMLEAVHRLREVGQELVLGRVRGATDRAYDDRLDRDRRSLEEACKTLHDQGEVLLDRVRQDLQDGVEGGAGGALGCGIIDKLHDRRDKDVVLLRAVILEPLAQTCDGDARGLAHAGVGVPETSLDERPHLVHERRHVLGAALDGNTKRKHGTAAARGVARREVVAD